MSVRRKKRSRKKSEAAESGSVPATPPPDAPELRHQADADAADREAAGLRLEAILETRAMPDDDDS